VSGPYTITVEADGYRSGIVLDMPIDDMLPDTALCILRELARHIGVAANIQIKLHDVVNRQDELFGGRKGEAKVKGVLEEMGAEVPPYVPGPPQDVPWIPETSLDRSNGRTQPVTYPMYQGAPAVTSGGRSTPPAPTPYHTWDDDLDMWRFDEAKAFAALDRHRAEIEKTHVPEMVRELEGYCPA
jgi:hypothetical protein